MSLFGPRSNEPRTSALRALKQLARQLFDATEDDAVVVSELQCTEPGCPPVETVVALLRAGSAARQVKIHKPVVDVTEADLRAAIRGEHQHGHADV